MEGRNVDDFSVVPLSHWSAPRGCGWRRMFAGRFRWVTARPHDTMMVIFTAGLLITSYLQWAAIADQLDEMRSQSEETLKLAAASSSQAETARKSLVATQRAWIGPTMARMDAKPTVGQDLQVIATYRNTGQEPARNVRWTWNYEVIGVRDLVGGAMIAQMRKGTSACLLIGERSNGTVVYPSAGATSQELVLTITGDKIDEELVSGAKYFVFRGCFAYRTADEVRHSAFCFYQGGQSMPTDHLAVCPEGNYAD